MLFDDHIGGQGFVEHVGDALVPRSAARHALGIGDALAPGQCGPGRIALARQMRLSGLLLDRMGELMGQQMATGGRLGAVATGAEDDVLANGVGESAHGPRRPGGPGVRMDADAAEVVFRAGLIACRAERLVGRALGGIFLVPPTGAEARSGRDRGKARFHEAACRRIQRQTRFADHIADQRGKIGARTPEPRQMSRRRPYGPCGARLPGRSCQSLRAHSIGLRDRSARAPTAPMSRATCRCCGS